MAKELGINTESLRKWVLQARGATGGGAGEAMTPDERADGGVRLSSRSRVERGSAAATAPVGPGTVISLTVPGQVLRGLPLGRLPCSKRV
ncbi:hypothetical protein [Streptomyces beijiangensis]|uniref:Uncharacterized protein n=1 Tax=Streptomyces beijiangensis TaxID=163361 RepID=A0A939F6J5_9ACTN|nr:hypothetical protein [Streptomyces beijiangensis]MBO0511917.1 hypothetical protein [Streptomyces beijiangensis]